MFGFINHLNTSVFVHYTKSLQQNTWCSIQFDFWIMNERYLIFTNVYFLLHLQQSLQEKLLVFMLRRSVTNRQFYWSISLAAAARHASIRRDRHASSKAKDQCVEMLWLRMRVLLNPTQYTRKESTKTQPEWEKNFTKWESHLKITNHWYQTFHLCI